MNLQFQKINNKWYVVLPEWTGDFEDLEMVKGADTLLEIISQKLHTTDITFDIWTAKPDFPTGHLRKIEQDNGGATYQVNNCMFYDGTAWLCNVTRFVFGGFHPIDIYFRVKQ